MHTLSLVKAALLGATLLCVAVGAGLAVPSKASAAADVQVTLIDCAKHPRKIAFQNKGDAAQNLTGWILLSNKPYQFDKPYSEEAYELSGPDRPGQIGPGEVFYVFNGHGNDQEKPWESGGSWVYSWNYTAELVESAFVLKPDGTDFIRLVDASAFPWREVSNMRCEDNTGPIPAFEQPSTPTPQPSNPDSGTGQTDGNQTASAQGDGTQSTSASQNAAATGNTATTSGAGTAAQPGSVSGAAGGPASGVGALALQISGGQPLGGHLLPLGLLGVVAGVALSLVAMRMLRRALQRP